MHELSIWPLGQASKPSEELLPENWCLRLATSSFLHASYAALLRVATEPRAKAGCQKDGSGMRCSMGAAVHRCIPCRSRRRRTAKKLQAVFERIRIFEVERCISVKGKASEMKEAKEAKAKEAKEAKETKEDKKQKRSESRKRRSGRSQVPNGRQEGVVACCLTVRSLRKS